MFHAEKVRSWDDGGGGGRDAGGDKGGGSRGVVVAVRSVDVGGASGDEVDGGREGGCSCFQRLPQVRIHVSAKGGCLCRGRASERDLLLTLRELWVDVRKGSIHVCIKDAIVPCGKHGLCPVRLGSSRKRRVVGASLGSTQSQRCRRAVDGKGREQDGLAQDESIKGRGVDQSCGKER